MAGIPRASCRLPLLIYMVFGRFPNEKMNVLVMVTYDKAERTKRSRQLKELRTLNNNSSWPCVYASDRLWLQLKYLWRYSLSLISTLMVVIIVVEVIGAADVAVLAQFNIRSTLA